MWILNGSEANFLLATEVYTDLYLLTSQQVKVVFFLSNYLVAGFSDYFSVAAGCCLIPNQKPNILTSPACCYLPAHGSVSRHYVTLPSLAVVRLEDTPALAGQAVHRQEARLAQTLSLPRPAAHHAARKLIAGQELAGICLIGCEEKRKKTQY